MSFELMFHRNTVIFHESCVNVLKKYDASFHQLYWEDLCKPKTFGAMDFRDFEGFNFYSPNNINVFFYLHFQCWQKSTGQVLSFQKFPGCFVGLQTLILWRSLLEGRNLLSLGMRYYIGNGLPPSIGHSKWMPSLNRFAPSSYFLFSRSRKGSD